MVARSRPTQGEVWWGEFEDKRRPLLVVSRAGAAAYLNRVVVAPLTRTVRGAPTEISVGPEVGLGTDSAASFDNLRTWPVELLTERVGAIDLPAARIRAALSAMADC